MDKVNLPVAEELGAGEVLTEDQIKAIADVKEEDWNQPPEGEEKPKEEPKKEEKKEDEEKKPPEEKPKEEKEEKTPEEEAAAKEAEEAEKLEKAENERLEKKAKGLEKTVEEVKEIETQEKTETDRIAKVAGDEGMTVEEVIESEKTDKSLAERHGSDPIKLARALRKEQSEYGKIKSEVDGLRDFKRKVEAQRDQFDEAHFNAQAEKGRDTIIDKFREKFPEESEELSDDTIFERGKSRIKKVYEDKAAESTKKVESDAKSRRTELLKDLSDEYKDFIPEVKELLAESDDMQILDKEFDIAFLANYARGKKYTSDYVKSLEEQAYKRGVEQPKIIPKVPGGKPRIDTDETIKVQDMSNDDKERAEELYGRREGWSKEKMYQTYMKSDKGNDF